MGPNDILRQIVGDFFKDLDEERLEKMLERNLREALESRPFMGHEHLGNRIMSMIEDQVVDRYVKENYNELIKDIDIKALCSLKEYKIAKKFSESL